MSKQPNQTLIGLFVVGAVMLVILGVLIFGSGKIFSTKSRYVLFFDESLKGLNIGAPVTFQGVKVGTVSKIQVRIRADRVSFLIPVFIEIETDTIKPYGEWPVELTPQELLAILIQRGLRARLGLQSLVTGQLQVEIDFFPDSPIRLVGYEPGYLEIPTITTTLKAMSKMLKKFPVEETLEKLVNAIDGLEKIATSQDLHAIVADLSASITELRSLIKSINARVDPLMAQVERTVTSTNTMVSNLDRRTATLTTGISTTLNEAQGLIRNIDDAVTPIASGFEDTTEAAAAALEQARRSLTVLEAFFDGDTVVSYNINQTFKELAEAVRNVRILTEYLEQHPEALLRGKAQPGGN